MILLEQNKSNTVSRTTILKLLWHESNSKTGVPIKPCEIDL